MGIHGCLRKKNGKNYRCQTLRFCLRRIPCRNFGPGTFLPHRRADLQQIFYGTDYKHINNGTSDSAGGRGDFLVHSRQQDAGIFKIPTVINVACSGVFIFHFDIFFRKGSIGLATADATSPNFLSSPPNIHSLITPAMRHNAIIRNTALSYFIFLRR